MRPTAFTGFGLFLRKLRLAKGLSARSVAQMSRGVHRMHGTPISQGYLSLLENGRPTTISLGKLMTLAGIYGASIQEFFSAAPPELRAKLHAEYHRWGEERNVLLDRAPFVDQVRRQLDARLDALFAARARPPVDVPAENPDGARAGLRGVLKVSALPALLCSAGQALPRRFWSARAGQVRDLLAAGLVADTLWKRMYGLCDQWLFCQEKRADQLAATIAHWTADYRASLASCHFAAPAQEQAYGYDLAPIALVFPLRWGQAAALLAAAAPRSLSLPPPPGPADALHAYLRWLVRPHESDPASWHGAAPAIAAALALASQLATQVPSLLQAGPPLPEGVAASVIRMISLALDQTQLPPR